MSTDPGSVAPIPGAQLDTGEEADAQRPSIDERRARRDEMEIPGRDRYDSLLRHLQAGRELPITPRRSNRRIGIEINRVGPRLLLIAAVVAAIWLGAIVVTDRLRAGQVDTWTGPDATVQSGLSLGGCDLPSFPEDSYFPGWIRFEGRIYRWADLSAPVSASTIPGIYEPTGYSLATLDLYLINSSQSGRDRERVMIRNGESSAGAVYILVPGCQ